MQKWQAYKRFTPWLISLPLPQQLFFLLTENTIPQPPVWSSLQKVYIDERISGLLTDADKNVSDSNVMSILFSIRN